MRAETACRASLGQRGRSGAAVRGITGPSTLYVARVLMTKLFWEDFAVGQVNEYGRQLVSAEDIKAFAAEFDPQPMHLDEEAARATLVGGLCASGWHTCAIMMRIAADGFILESSSMGATGCDEVKWLAPVRPGDRLRVRVEVLDTRPSASRPGMGFVNARFDVLNADDVRVMTLTAHLIFRRRNGRPAAEYEVRSERHHAHVIFGRRPTVPAAEAGGPRVRAAGA